VLILERYFLQVFYLFESIYFSLRHSRGCHEASRALDELPRMKYSCFASGRSADRVAGADHCAFSPPQNSCYKANSSGPCAAATCRSSMAACSTAAACSPAAACSTDIHQAAVPACSSASAACGDVAHGMGPTPAGYPACHPDSRFSHLSQAMSARSLQNFMQLDKGVMSSSFPFFHSPTACGMSSSPFFERNPPPFFRYNFPASAPAAQQHCCCRRTTASDSVDDCFDDAMIDVDDVSPSVTVLSPPSPPLSLLSAAESDRERWKRHVRKMDAIEEHNDYENIVRLWDVYSHKKFRSFQTGGGRSAATAAATEDGELIKMAATSSEPKIIVAARPTETHQLLQMPGAAPRQSVIMISKKAAEGVASSPPLQLDVLAPLPPAIILPSEERTDEEQVEERKDIKEEVGEELGSLVEEQGDTLETLVQILQVILLFFAKVLNNYYLYPVAFFCS
jgi:hypothetical protein